MRISRIVVIFCLFAVWSTFHGENALAVTITLISGNGPFGSADPANDYSLNGGATFQDAIVIVANGAYDTIPGTQWISVSESGYGAGNQTTLYRTSFVLPAGYSNPSLQIQLHADNIGTVLLNGFQFGQQSLIGDQSNFTNPPSLFAISDPAHFQAGVNLLDIQVQDLGEPSGLDYMATVDFIPEPSTVVQCVVGLLGLGLVMRGKRTR